MYLFYLSFSYSELLHLLVPLQTYIWQKKNWALLIDLFKVKKNNILHNWIHGEGNGR